MKTLPLYMLMLVAAGCSKSSSANSDKTKLVKPAPITDCDDICTNMAICYERFYQGETYKYGGACSEECRTKSAAERLEYAQEIADAMKTKDCAPLFEEADMASGPMGAALGAGPVELGCFAWSEKLSTAACIVERRGHLELAFVGAGGLAAVRLADAGITIDEAHAEKATQLLVRHDFEHLTDGFESLAESTPQTLPGATLILVNNIVMASCDSAGSIELFNAQGKDVNVFANPRAAGSSHVIIEVWLERGDRGNLRDMQAVLLDTATCKVLR